MEDVSEVDGSVCGGIADSEDPAESSEAALAVAVANTKRRSLDVSADRAVSFRTASAATATAIDDVSSSEVNADTFLCLICYNTLPVGDMHTPAPVCVPCPAPGECRSRLQLGTNATLSGVVWKRGHRRRNWKRRVLRLVPPAQSHLAPILRYSSAKPGRRDDATPKGTFWLSAAGDGTRTLVEQVVSGVEHAGLHFAAQADSASGRESEAGDDDGSGRLSERLSALRDGSVGRLSERFSLRLSCVQL